MKFPLGQTVATPGALEALAEAGQTGLEFLARHQAGDWGDCCKDDAQANERALNDESRIWSIYHTSKGVKLYVITEADRSSTCILLPSEY